MVRRRRLRRHSGLWCSLVILGCSYGAMATAADTPPPACTAGREFITTFSYLKTQQFLGLNPAQMGEIAQDVAQGCDQAAQRFIDGLELLIKAGATPREAIREARNLAHVSQNKAEAFLSIYKTAFLENYLNFDLGDSLTLAKDLSLNYCGDVATVGKTFHDLIQFCVDKNHLGLSRPACAKLFVKITKTGEYFPTENPGERFFQAYSFMVDDKQGPGMTSMEAIQLIEQLFTKAGPYAAENFISTYKFIAADQNTYPSRDNKINMAKRIAVMATKPKSGLKPDANDCAGPVSN